MNSSRYFIKTGFGLFEADGQLTQVPIGHIFVSTNGKIPIPRESWLDFTDLAGKEIPEGFTELRQVTKEMVGTTKFPGIEPSYG